MNSFYEMKSVPILKWNLQKLWFSSLIYMKTPTNSVLFLFAINEGHFGKTNRSNYFLTNIPIVDLWSSLLSNILDLRYFKYSLCKTFDMQLHVPW